jgi:hypothetical protein
MSSETKLNKELDAFYEEWTSSKSDSVLESISTRLIILGKAVMTGKQQKHASAFEVMMITVSDLLAELLQVPSPYNAEKATFSTYCWNRIDWDLKENRRDPFTKAHSLQQLAAKVIRDNESGERTNEPPEYAASVHRIDAAGVEELPENLTDRERLYIELATKEGDGDDKYEKRRAVPQTHNQYYKNTDEDIAAQMSVSTKTVYRIRESIREKVEQMDTTPKKRPAYNLGKGNPVRVCKTWEEYNALIANVYPGAFYPAYKPKPSKTRYSFDSNDPAKHLTKAFDLVGAA